MPTKRRAPDEESLNDKTPQKKKMPDEESLDKMRQTLLLPLLTYPNESVDTSDNEWSEEFEDQLERMRFNKSRPYPAFALLVKYESPFVLSELNKDNIVEEKKAHFEEGLDKLLEMNTKYASALQDLCKDAKQFIVDYQESFSDLRQQAETDLYDIDSDDKETYFLKSLVTCQEKKAKET